MSLIYILIVLFSLLLLYQVYLAFNKVEGFKSNVNANNTNVKEYQPYNLGDPNNSLILAQQNAGNIEVLKGRMDNFTGLQDNIKNRVDDMKQSIDSIQTQIDGLVQQQAIYAEELVGSTPLEITGTDQETVEDVEDSIEEEK